MRSVKNVIDNGGDIRWNRPGPIDLEAVCNQADKPEHLQQFKVAPLAEGNISKDDQASVPTFAAQLAGGRDAVFHGDDVEAHEDCARTSFIKDRDNE